MADFSDNTRLDPGTLPASGTGNRSDSTENTDSAAKQPSEVILDSEMHLSAQMPHGPEPHSPLDPDAMYEALEEKLRQQSHAVDLGRIHAAYEMAKTAHSGQKRKPVRWT